MDVINRNNYEAYFLLYADNELTPAQKQEVEAFVLLHPDLAPEFEALQNTRLHPEDLTFDHKHLLYKSSPSMEITAENCEEYFILYFDNELDAESRRAVDNFVAANPSVKESFDVFASLQLNADTNEVFPEISSLYRLPSGDSYTTLLDYVDGELPASAASAFAAQLKNDAELNKEYELLSQTRLQPDMDVRYPNIRSLYRKEEKERRVIPMWARYAAAAAVLLFVTWAAFIRNNGKQKADEAVAVTQQPVNNPGQPQPVQQPQTNNSNNTVADNNSINSNYNIAADVQPVNNPLNSSTNNNGSVTSGLPVRNNNKQVIQTVPGPELKEHQGLVQEQQKPANQLPEELKKIIDKPQANETIAKANPETVNKITPPENQSGNNAITIASPEEEEGPASTSIMNIPVNQIAKTSGIKSVGRKIGRFFERKLKTNGKPFSIGGVEVALAR